MEINIFKAKIEDSIIWVWAVGKWRPIRKYTVKGKLPSAKIQDEVLHKIWINCGKGFDKNNTRLHFIEK